MEECFVEQTLDVITKRILQREYARARFANVDEDALTLDAQLLGAKAAALLRQSGGVQLTDGVSEGVWWFARLFGAVLATIATFNKSLAESWLEHESTDAAYWPFTASAEQVQIAYEALTNPKEHIALPPLSPHVLASLMRRMCGGSSNLWSRRERRQPRVPHGIIIGDSVLRAALTMDEDEAWDAVIVDEIVPCAFALLQRFCLAFTRTRRTAKKGKPNDDDEVTAEDEAREILNSRYHNHGHVPSLFDVCMVALWVASKARGVDHVCILNRKFAADGRFSARFTHWPGRFRQHARAHVVAPLSPAKHGPTDIERVMLLLSNYDPCFDTNLALLRRHIASAEADEKEDGDGGAARPAWAWSQHHPERPGAPNTFKPNELESQRQLAAKAVSERHAEQRRLAAEADARKRVSQSQHVSQRVRRNLQRRRNQQPRVPTIQREGMHDDSFDEEVREIRQIFFQKPPRKRKKTTTRETKQTSRNPRRQMSRVMVAARRKGASASRSSSSSSRHAPGAVSPRPTFASSSSSSISSSQHVPGAVSPRPTFASSGSSNSSSSRHVPGAVSPRPAVADQPPVKRQRR